MHFRYWHVRSIIWFHPTALNELFVSVLGGTEALPRKRGLKGSTCSNLATRRCQSGSSAGLQSQRTCGYMTCARQVRLPAHRTRRGILKTPDHEDLPRKLAAA